MKLSENAIRVLRSRYLLQNAEGRELETPDQLFNRVAQFVARAELKSGDRNKETYWAAEFYKIMTELDFLPNSPTLMNAGTQLNQLSACFVLPVGDSLHSIFTTLKDAMLIQQSGGGTGFNFSNIRPRGHFIESTGGQASGPVTFMKVYDASTGSIKQGGKRRGANMGILNIDHPDIEEFISCKKIENELVNFNISVGISNAFMQAVENDTSWNLKYGDEERIYKTLPARQLWSEIMNAAWQSGDPGIIFIDEINKTQPTPSVGVINCTNPCGEVPLLPYEACNLGSVNLSNMVLIDGKEIDWNRLERVVRTGVRFLDNVISQNTFVLSQIEEMVTSNRKIGLGVMGWAEMLIKLGIPYASVEAVSLAEKVMSFIADVSFDQSYQLALSKGSFPNWDKSVYYSELPVRNATRTCIAPTGTISILSNTSSSIEPLFALAFTRQHVLHNESMQEINPLFLDVLEKNKLKNEKNLQTLFATGSAEEINGLSTELKAIFNTAMAIPPEVHLNHQWAFQKFTDNAVSKTINLPNHATVNDVHSICLNAWKKKLKGITVFRTGCKSQQVLQKGMHYESGCKICID